MAKRKRTNSDLQNTSQKTKDRATRIPFKTGSEAMCSGRVGSSCSTCGTRHTLAVRCVCNKSVDIIDTLSCVSD